MCAVLTRDVGVQDAYMPKDSLKQAHRGIGFVTYTSPEPVDVVLAMPHSLHGVELAVDMATAKEGRVGTLHRV